jgi:hypothetical protein
VHRAQARDRWRPFDQPDSLSRDPERLRQRDDADLGIAPSASQNGSRSAILGVSRR